MRLKLRVNISDLSVFQSVKMKSVDFLNISEYVCLFDIFLMNCIFYKLYFKIKWCWTTESEWASIIENKNWEQKDNL